MIVKELFERADFKKIARKEAEDDWELNHDNTKTEEEKESIRQWIEKYTYECYQKIMDISPNANPEDIVVCKKVTNLDDGGSYMDSFLVHKSDLLEKKLRYIDYDSNEYENIPMEEYEKQYIQHYAYEFEPWEEILGYTVASSCVEEYGIDEIASAIFNEMTFFGMEQDSAEERKETEKKILEERVKEIEEHPECCIPADKVFKDLYKELGIDPPTKKEEEDQRELWKKERKINQEEDYRIMVKVIEEFKD